MPAMISFRRIFQQKGGIGMPSATQCYVWAYLGSIALAASHIESITKAWNPNITALHIEAILGLPTLSANHFPNHDELPIYDPTIYPRKNVQEKLTQTNAERWTTKTDEYVLSHHKSKTNSDERYAQRYLSSQDPWAGAVPFYFPQHDPMRLTDLQMQDYVCLRIGVTPPLPPCCSL